MAVAPGPIVNTFSVIRRHEVLSYFLLVFAVSWGGILILVLPGGLAKTTTELDALFVPVFLVMLVGPSLAGLILTVMLEGSAGMRSLLAVFTRWRVPAPYFLVVLAAPTVALMVLGVFSAFSPVFSPAIFGPAGGLPLLAAGIGIGLAAGTLEELGWTGFAARRLLRAQSVLTTAVLIGIPHGLWHFLVAYFWGDGASYGLLFLPYFVVAWIATLTALRLLIVWLYQRTQSGLIATLTHASYTASLMVLWPVGTSPMETLVWTAVFALVLLAAVAALTRTFPNKVVIA